MFLYLYLYIDIYRYIYIYIDFFFFFEVCRLFLCLQCALLRLYIVYDL